MKKHKSVSQTLEIYIDILKIKGFSIEGVLFSTMPPFYPSVAEARGLTPAQVFDSKEDKLLLFIYLFEL